MWKIVLTTLQNLLTLARDLEDNRKEIKEVNEKIFQLASAVRSLSEKIDSNANTRHQNEGVLPSRFKMSF